MSIAEVNHHRHPGPEASDRDRAIRDARTIVTCPENVHVPAVVNLARQYLRELGLPERA